MYILGAIISFIGVGIVIAGFVYVGKIVIYNIKDLNNEYVPIDKWDHDKHVSYILLGVGLALMLIGLIVMSFVN
jgi:hypothetical protein